MINFHSCGAVTAQFFIAVEKTGVRWQSAVGLLSAWSHGVFRVAP